MVKRGPGIRAPERAMIKEVANMVVNIHMVVIADCGFKIKEPGVRIQNSGGKQSKLSLFQLLATDYWLLDSIYGA
jgi:hypothetical protein